MTGQADAGVADEAAVDAVLTASRTLIAVATSSLGAAAEDTTIAQYRALVVLASRGPQRMTDLAGALDVTPSTAGRMCDRLLRKALIRRHRARADRRAVQVSITPAGRQVVDQATARRRALIAGILRRLRRPGSWRWPPRCRSSPWRPGRSRTACGPPIRLRRRRRARPAGSGRRPAGGARHDGPGRGQHAGRDAAAGRAGRQLAAGFTGWPVRHRGGGGRGVGAGCGGVPVPDLLLHLAGHRARAVRPGRLRRQ